MSEEKEGIKNALNLPSIEELREITDGSIYNIDFGDEDESEELDLSEVSQEQIKTALENMEKLKEYRRQLKDIPDITKRKNMLDKLAAMAEQKFLDVYDRGFNCEDRFMADIINAANSMLKMALDAHSKVIDSDIKLIDMQIKKDKMEIDINLKNKTNVTLGDEEVAPAPENVTRANRNELLARRKKNK